MTKKQSKTKKKSIKEMAKEVPELTRLSELDERLKEMQLKWYNTPDAEIQKEMAEIMNDIRIEINEIKIK
jgi:hypothetical protein|tara:strand:- start:260 stop:469 length:210 start_codon:yes stop_codon:yes gene_type:complete